MIKNVVFDIGNVLAEFRYKEFIAELGIPEDKRARVAKATAEGPYWPLMDKGVLSSEMTMYNCIALDPECEAEIRLYFRDQRRLVMEYPDSCDWIRSVKATGRKVYLLSNYSKENYELGETELFEFPKLVDGKVISYTVKQLKPGEEIYRLLFDRFDLKPEECVFLDDSLRNVETARRLGMAAIHVTDRDKAKEELEHLLS